MNPAPATPTLQSAAPTMARRFGIIMAALHALVAHAFLRHPSRVRLILPLCGYLGRTMRRFQRLAARVAAGQLPRSRSRTLSRARSTTLCRAVPLPSRHGWLAAELGYQARNHASQLAALLAEPATAELLAATPAAARLLRPICRMLGLPPIPPPAGAPAAARPPAPALRLPLMVRAAPLPPPQPPSPARSRTLADPPCERLRDRWPWLPWSATAPA